MIYLASPYSDPDPAVREERYQAACRATAFLLDVGYLVFSPVVHGHPLVALGLPGEWSFWAEIDRLYLERCEELWVLELEGWQQSRGVQAELALARELGLPIHFQPLESLSEPGTPPQPLISSHFLPFHPVR